MLVFPWWILLHVSHHPVQFLTSHLPPYIMSWHIDRNATQLYQGIQMHTPLRLTFSPCKFRVFLISVALSISVFNGTEHEVPFAASARHLLDLHLGRSKALILISFPVWIPCSVSHKPLCLSLKRWQLPLWLAAFFWSPWFCNSIPLWDFFSWHGKHFSLTSAGKPLILLGHLDQTALMLQPPAVLQFKTSTSPFVCISTALKM